MIDPTVAWFLGKHFLLASVMFPEITLVWSVWMRREILVLILSVYVLILMMWRLTNTVMTIARWLEPPTCPRCEP